MQSKVGAADLYSCCLNDPPSSPHILLHNKFGALEDVSAQFQVDNGAGMTVSPYDIDRDGRLDAFLGNDFGHHGWYMNRGDSFSLLTTAAGMRPYAHIMGSVVADFDGDQRDDLFVTDWGAATMYRGTDKGFVDVSEQWGVWPDTQNSVNWVPLAEDLDRDGWPDLVTTVSAVTQPGKIGLAETGDPSVFLPGYHLVGHNMGTFMANQKLSWPDGSLSGFAGLVAAVGDYDHDGDLDLFMLYAQTKLGVWRNDTAQGNHWINIHTVDAKGPVIGATVQVWAQGHVQERLVRDASGWGGKHAPVARFGLGTVDKLDLVQIRWPSGQVTQVVAPLVDQELVVQKP